MTRPLHVIVLAAGRGSRLGALGDDRPKWLLPVGGRTIADRHLAGIAAAGEAVASTRVVVGHAAEAIERELAGRAERVGLVRNPDFATINNWWSLLLALRDLPAGAPVAVVNADLMTAPATVAGFLTAAAESDDEALMAVDFERRLTDESMKVERQANGTLHRIGKVGIDRPVGEYVGMLSARGAALRRLHTTLESFVGVPESANEWYERAVGMTAAAGVPWALWPMPGSDWVEIDDDADLDAATALAAAT